MVSAVWHLLIREEFAWRTGLGQLVCCVLSCDRDAAGWHGLGPSDWAAVFGSSKSSALRPGSLCWMLVLHNPIEAISLLLKEVFLILILLRKLRPGGAVACLKALEWKGAV